MTGVAADRLTRRLERLDSWPPSPFWPPVVDTRYYPGQEDPQVGQA
jgi:hypothetical protein